MPDRPSHRASSCDAPQPRDLALVALPPAAWWRRSWPVGWRTLSRGWSSWRAARVTDTTPTAEGAPWVDSLTLVLNAAVFGDHDPETLVAGTPILAAVDRDALTAAVAGLAGYFSWQGRQAARPEMPTIRGFQLAQAATCLRWLRTRLDGTPRRRHASTARPA